MCGGSSVRIKQTGVFGWDQFQFYNDRECKTCGALWRPAIPRWGAGLMIGLGIVVLVGAALTMLVIPANEKHVRDLVWGFSGLAAAYSIGYGVLALLGVCGQLGIRRGPRTPA